MPGGNSTTTNQTQSSTTNPYAPAQPMLQSILNTLGQGSAAVTPQQSAALSQLTSEAGAVPSFAGQATGAVGNLFNSNTAPQQTTLQNAYNTVSGGLTPLANGSMVDPMSNPAVAGLIATTNQDTTNAINDQFAASGRTGSPANVTALARGLSQGESGILANQYDANVGNQLGAAAQLESAAGNTASGITGQQQIQLGNGAQGITAAGAIPGLLTAPGATSLAAANTAYGLPYSNLQQLEGLTVPIAGLGSSSTGTSNGTVTQQTPWYTTLLGGGLMGASLFGGGSNSAANGIGNLFTLSDERVKDNKRQIGMLFDGLPVYSYNYEGDDTPRIGLMAQDVEKVRPDAVSETDDGVKMVHYGRATEGARHIAGMLG